MTYRLYLVLLDELLLRLPEKLRCMACAFVLESIEFSAYAIHRIISKPVFLYSPALLGALDNPLGLTEAFSCCFAFLFSAPHAEKCFPTG